MADVLVVVACRLLDADAPALVGCDVGWLFALDGAGAGVEDAALLDVTGSEVGSSVGVDAGVDTGADDTS